MSTIYTPELGIDPSTTIASAETESSLRLPRRIIIGAPTTYLDAVVTPFSKRNPQEGLHILRFTTENRPQVEGFKAAIKSGGHALLVLDGIAAEGEMLEAMFLAENLRIACVCSRSDDDLVKILPDNHRPLALLASPKRSGSHSWLQLTSAIRSISSIAADALAIADAFLPHRY